MTFPWPNWSTGPRAVTAIAWDELVDRFAPLVWSVCQRFGMRSGGHRGDRAERVAHRWWRTFGNVREPAALPGWLATTTRRECLRVLRGRRQREQRELHSDEEVARDAPTTPTSSRGCWRRNATTRCARASASYQHAASSSSNC